MPLCVCIGFQGVVQRGKWLLQCPQLALPRAQIKERAKRSLCPSVAAHMGRVPVFWKSLQGPWFSRASGSQYFELWETTALGGFSTLQGNSHPGLCSISPAPTTQPCADAGLYQDGLSQVPPLQAEAHRSHEQAGAERTSISLPCPLTQLAMGVFACGTPVTCSHLGVSDNQVNFKPYQFTYLFK